MSTGKVYKQAIKRVFAERYHDERMAVYWGREDDTIHVSLALAFAVSLFIGVAGAVAQSDDINEAVNAHCVTPTLSAPPNDPPEMKS